MIARDASGILIEVDDPQEEPMEYRYTERPLRPGPHTEGLPMSIAATIVEELIEEIGYLKWVISNMEAYSLANMPIKPNAVASYFVSEGDTFVFDGPYDSEDAAIADCPNAEYVRIIQVKAPEGVTVEVEYWEQDIEQEGEEC